MLKRTLSGITLTLLFISMSTLALSFNVQQAKSDWTGTVYIRADGSIDPPEAPIVTYDNFTYILTGNITSSDDGIIVERNNIIIDGKGYTLQGSGSGKGFYLSGINNVTIKNTHTKNFYHGIRLENSYNNYISGNNITSIIMEGIYLSLSSNVSVSENNIKDCKAGIYLERSYNVSVSGNNIKDSECGIAFYYSSDSSVCGNNIANNTYGMVLSSNSYNNVISGNNITNNNRGISLRYSKLYNLS